MKNRLLAFFTLIFLVGSLASASLVAQTTIYVVRHAEKMTTLNDRDPVLSAAGTKRAQALARTLRSAKLTTCLATQFKRTTQTVRPAAQAFGLKVEKYRAGKEKDLARKLATEFSGKNILVAGHSNTVPGILRHLGLKDKIALTDSDYDNLFVVKIAKDGKASLVHLHYGAANPKK